MQGTMRVETTAPGETAAVGNGTAVGTTEIRVRGQSTMVPAVEIYGRTVVVTGKRLKIASVQDEDLCEGETVREPISFISALKASALGADLFTFCQRIPNTSRLHDYYTEWGNDATLPITTYEHWLKEGVEYSIRKSVNKAKRVGVVAECTAFDDEFVKAICRIYSEAPARQGRAFWHYKKDFETVKHELGTYLDRSVFIGAYYQGELIGSLKMTYVGSTAPIMQIFCSQNHFDKRPNNALLAKAVEICEQHGKEYLIYGNFTYNDVDSSLTEFKRRNGFKPVDLPRYYVPLTLKGALALRLRLHRGLVGWVPPRLLKRAREVRAAWYARRSKQSAQAQG